MNGRINQALTVIAGDLDICLPVEAVTVEDGAVFYGTGNGPRCAFQVGTAYGHECCAKEETAALMEHMRKNFSR